jgi:hypothetical protein
MKRHLYANEFLSYSQQQILSLVTLSLSCFLNFYVSLESELKYKDIDGRTCITNYLYVVLFCLLLF